MLSIVTAAVVPAARPNAFRPLPSLPSAMVMFWSANRDRLLVPLVVTLLAVTPVLAALMLAAILSISAPFLNLTSTPFRVTEVSACRPALVVPAFRPNADSAPGPVKPVPLSNLMSLLLAEVSTRRPLSFLAVTPVRAVPEPTAPAPLLLMLSTTASRSSPAAKLKIVPLISISAAAARPVV
ncbi:hypothetical protein D3C87_1673540 [compost metagenome]